MSEGTLYRLGSAAAIVGGVLAVVTNFLHPRISDFDDPVGAELAAVAKSDGWIAIHLGILLASLLIIFALFAVARSIKAGGEEGLARVALGTLLISAPVAVLTVSMDGYATKAAADAWAAASGGAKEVAAAAGSAVVHTGWGAFMAFIILFLGVTPVFYGWAVSASAEYPPVLGWGAVVLGLGSIVAGVIGTIGGPSTGFFVLFTITSGLLTLWVLILGILLGRKAAVPTERPAPSPA